MQVHLHDTQMLLAHWLLWKKCVLLSGTEWLLNTVVKTESCGKVLGGNGFSVATLEFSFLAAHVTQGVTLTLVISKVTTHLKPDSAVGMVHPFRPSGSLELAVKFLITHYKGVLKVGGSVTPLHAAQNGLWLTRWSGYRGETNSLHHLDSIKHRLFLVWHRFFFFLFSSYFCLVWAMFVVLEWYNDYFDSTLIHTFLKICSKVNLRKKMCFLQAVLICYRLLKNC